MAENILGIFGKYNPIEMESLLRKSDGFIGYKIRAKALPIANLVPK
jgi:hypothetical protein